MSFHPWLRGRLDGIPAELGRALQSSRCLCKRGLLDLSVQYQVPVWRLARPYLKLEFYDMLNNQKLICWNTVVTPVTTGPTDELGLPTTYEASDRIGEGTSVADYPPYLPGLDGGRSFRMALGFQF